MGYTIADIGGVPEDCIGLEMNWAKYVPAGGYEWQINFRNDKMPTIAGVVKEIRDEVTRLNGVISSMNDLKTKMHSATQFFRDLKAFINAGGEAEKPELVQFFSMYEGVFGMNPEDPKVHFNTRAIKEKRDVLLVNLDYAETLSAFFDTDNEFDKLLFAMNSVEPKFRTKIFRKVWKMYAEQKERLFKINTMKCDARSELEPVFEQGIKEMNTAYSACDISLKAVKKGLEKEGGSYWSNRMDPIESMKMLGFQFRHNDWK